MKKIVRDFVLSFLVCMTYVLLFDGVEDPILGAIAASAAGGATFAVFGNIIRASVEEFINSRKSLTESEARNLFQMTLVARDSILVFLVCHSYMAHALIGPVSLANGLGYIVAALVPTLIVAIVSAELRVPFLIEYRNKDAVLRNFN